METRESIIRHIDKSIKFTQKEKKKHERKGQKKLAMQCYQSIEMGYELRRMLID